MSGTPKQFVFLLLLVGVSMAQDDVDIVQVGVNKALHNDLDRKQASPECANQAPYTWFSDQSSDANHGDACFKPDGPFKGGGDWECPDGCTKLPSSAPWCGQAGQTTSPCRVTQAAYVISTTSYSWSQSPPSVSCPSGYTQVPCSECSDAVTSLNAQGEPAKWDSWSGAYNVCARYSSSDSYNNDVYCGSSTTLNSGNDVNGVFYPICKQAPAEVECAPGCPQSWVGDGFCERLDCDNAQCNHDGGDCDHGAFEHSRSRMPPPGHPYYIRRRGVPAPPPAPPSPPRTPWPTPAPYVAPPTPRPGRGRGDPMMR